MAAPQLRTAVGTRRTLTLLAVLAAGIAACSLAGGAATPDEARADQDWSARFPSASQCRTCHPRHYRQWSASPHAYAQLSPVFNAMHATILKKTKGTLGDFCIRCHTPIGMTMGEPLFTSNLERHPTSREGITCVVCHRVDRAHGKVSGRRSLVEGDIVEPIFGPTGGEELRRVIADPAFKVETTSDGQGRKIHGDAEALPALRSPGFCGACHDVTLPNGFRLEEAFSEYKVSPAAGRGESCQDCHMGTEPGVASGYAQGPAAVVGGVPTRTRRATDHTFVGPDYSVVHPGLYPHNPNAQRLATLEEWLQFDHEAGWGNDDFEDGVTSDVRFPERWNTIDDRIDARAIIDQQLALLAEVDAKRTALLRAGYRLGEIEIERADRSGVAFAIDVHNGTDGHNVPTGFTAERLVFLQVRVLDAGGAIVFESGDLDPNGDLRDAHSLYVHAGALPRDDQLFSLQSKFVTRNLRGGEREQVLAVNESFDVLPYVRPETFASVLLARPADARIHKVGIEPGGTRRARYSVPARALAERAGPFRVEVALRAGMVPVNLVGAIQGVGFDYGLSPRAVADRIVAGHRILWQRDAVVDVE